MTTQKPTLKTLYQYWHPRKGGWYYGTLVHKGYKWAVIKPFALDQKVRVPVADVREVA